VPVSVKEALVYDHKQVYPFFVRREIDFHASVTIQVKVKVKVKVRDWIAQKGVDVQLCTLLTSALEEGGWSAPHPGRFTPGKDAVHIVHEAGWAPGKVWTGAENLALPGFVPRTVDTVASCYTD
jgi:hypothetical protein